MVSDKINGDIDELISRLYEAALDEKAWQGAVELIARITDAHSASMLVVDRKTGKVISDCSSGIDMSIGETVAGQQAYENYYAALDYRRQYASQLPAGAWFQCHERFPLEVIKHTEFFNEYVKPWDLRHLAGCRLIDTERHSVYVGLMRREAQLPLGPAQMTLLNRINHHLRRASTLYLHHQVLRAEWERGFDALHTINRAICIVGKDGKLLFVNIAAEQMLREFSAIAVLNGKIQLPERDHDNSLKAVISRAARLRESGTVRTQISKGRDTVSLSIFALPLPSQHRFSELTQKAVVLVLVSDRDVSGNQTASILRRICGLSTREAELACAIADGDTLRLFADRNSVKITTVRTQLRAVMQKTGFRRQIDLVRMLSYLPRLP